MTREEVQKLLPDGYFFVAGPEAINRATPLHIRCPKGHDWKTARLGNIEKGNLCRRCADDARGNASRLSSSEILERYRRLNFELLEPYQGMGKSIRYRCLSCGFEKKSKPLNITRSCGYCRKREQSRKAAEDLLAERGERVLSRVDATSISRSTVIVLCARGHEYQNIQKNLRNRNQGCPYCYGNAKKTIAEIRQAVLGLGFSLDTEDYENEHGTLEIRCEHGHPLQSNWNKIQRYGLRCQTCHPTGVSAGELQLLSVLRQWGLEVLHRDRHLGCELDLYLPQQKIAIEFTGLYYHSELFKDQLFHQRKWAICRSVGIELFTIYEDEWRLKKEIVEDLLRSRLGLLKRVPARKALVRDVDWKTAREFLNRNHLQGAAPHQKALGLYLNGELLMLMTLGKHHRNTVSDEVRVISRIASEKGTLVVGGGSKLLAAAKLWAKAVGAKELRTQSDRRISSGNFYRKVGLTWLHEQDPDYYYFKSGKRFSKQSLRKRPGELGTEKELRRAEGYLRIYDCGKDTWILKL